MSALMHPTQIGIRELSRPVTDGTAWGALPSTSTTGTSLGPWNMVTHTGGADKLTSLNGLGRAPGGRQTAQNHAQQSLLF